MDYTVSLGLNRWHRHKAAAKSTNRHSRSEDVQNAGEVTGARILGLFSPLMPTVIGKVSGSVRNLRLHTAYPRNCDGTAAQQGCASHVISTRPLVPAFRYPNQDREIPRSCAF
jgi:hypothetical protein